jgi:hypothetical protein
MCRSTVCRYTIRKRRIAKEEFLAHIVLPIGKGTVGDWLMPQIDKAYESGKMPPLLPGW